VRRSVLPPILPAGTNLGRLSSDAARDLGLRAGIAVAVGGADTQCALLGLGATFAGAAGIVAGTSAPVQLVCDRAVIDPAARAWTQCHLVPGRWLVESNAGPLGEALEWAAALLFADAAQPCTRLLAEASCSLVGATGMLATLGAPVSDPRTMGIPVASLSFSPLVQADDPERRRHAARAAIEGAAFSLRANLEYAANVAGFAPSTVCIGGGLSASATWLSVLSDVLATPLRVGPSPESSALGAALCAGIAAGAWPDLEAAVRSVVPSQHGATPDPQRAAAYERIYDIWQRHAAARAPSDAAISELLTPEFLRAHAAGGETAMSAVRPRILATADLDAASLAALRALGPLDHASFREAMRLLAGSALVEALEGVEVFITEVDVLDAAALAKLPALRVVAACRGDAVNVDIEACTAHGIPVLFAPGRNADAVADLTLAYLLMLLRHFPEAGAFLRLPGIDAGDLGRMGQAFSQLRGRELWGKTVGLLGLGAVGRGVAKRLRGFGARVLVHDPFVSREHAALADAEWVEWAELLAASDVVSLHAPVSDTTRRILGTAALARMKRGALLVNTARAALVDEAALAAALASGHLAGAALDVFDVEPPGSGHPLLAFPNVIATPHVGGNTFEVAAHQGRIVAADLARMLRGEAPEHLRNPETLAGFSWRGARREPDPEQLARLAKRPAPAVTDLQRDAKQKEEPKRSRIVSSVQQRSSAPPELAQKMHAILDRFVGGCTNDAELERFAANCDVTLHFQLTDLDESFWLRLRSGISGALGAPDGRPEVELKMRADVLDGMFTGRVNPMQAAMNGRLSFTGDAAKAMTLQQIQPALARHYRAARDAVGDPGDLAALPDPSGAPTANAAPASGSDAVREELVQVVRELYAQQLITATGGNVSARIFGSDEAWITPSQLFKGDLRPEILVRMGLDGTTLETLGAAPSSERLMHCAVYRARPDAQAVVHAHATHATILANAGLPFLPISTEAAFFGDLPRVPFIMPGSEALAQAVEVAAGESWAVLLVNHGLLVAGRSLRRAADMVEIIERSAEVILGCYAVGKEPPVLPAKIVAELRALGDLVA
jgi:autoinducer 2 (AI-2) kinase